MGKVKFIQYDRIQWLWGKISNKRHSDCGVVSAVWKKEENIKEGMNTAQKKEENCQRSTGAKQSLEEDEEKEEEKKEEEEVEEAGE